MKNYFLLIFTILVISMSSQTENPYKKYIENLPFDMPEVKAPTFPDHTVNIKDFNAKGDGKTLCTEAFAKAVETLSSQGGGKL